MNLLEYNHEQETRLIKMQVITESLNPYDDRFLGRTTCSHSFTIHAAINIIMVVKFTDRDDTYYI